MAADLLPPCPHCGSSRVDVCAAESGSNPPSCVICEDCQARGPVRARVAEAEAAWRMRRVATPATTGEAVEPPADPIERIRWHLDGIDGHVYADNHELATRELVMQEVRAIHEILRMRLATPPSAPTAGTGTVTDAITEWLRRWAPHSTEKRIGLMARDLAAALAAAAGDSK